MPMPSKQHEKQFRFLYLLLRGSNAWNLPPTTSWGNSTNITIFVVILIIVIAVVVVIQRGETVDVTHDLICFRYYGMNRLNRIDAVIDIFVVVIDCRCDTSFGRKKPKEHYKMRIFINLKNNYSKESFKKKPGLDLL